MRYLDAAGVRQLKELNDAAYVGKEEYNDDTMVISAALNDLNSRVTTAESEIAGFSEGDENIIETVKVNGTALTVTDKAVDVTVPTTLASLTDDSTHRLVTDTEKTKLQGIAAGAEVNVQSDWSVTDSTSDAYIVNKPTIPTKVSDLTNDSGFTTNTGTITGVTMNGVSKGTSGVVDLGTVITDVSGKADASAAIGTLSLAIDNTNYQITLSGTKVDGTTFTVSNVIDLPLESVVVNGSYNNTTKKVVLTLQNGNTVDFSVADLVAGLQSEITSTNKLSADLISDGTTNKVYTATEQTKLAGIAAGAEVNVNADWNASSGDAQILNKPTIPTDSTVSGWGYIKSYTETDPVFSASAAAGISSSDITNWNGKTSNTGTITSVKMNGSTVSSSGEADLGTVITSHATHALNATNGTASAVNQGTEITYVESITGTSVATSGDLSVSTTRKKVTIPTAVTESTVSGWGFTKNAGTLTEHAKHKLTATNGTATSASGTITYVESLTGTNTATDGNLTVTATRKTVTIPSAPGTLKTNNSTAQTTSASESLTGTINLHKVAKTGTYSDLIGTPTIPTVNNSTISIQKGGTAVDSFTTNASSGKTINIPNELPSYSSSDSGKILSVNSSGALVWITPSYVYSGSSAPSNSIGNNGDIYLQTS